MKTRWLTHFDYADRFLSLEALSKSIFKKERKNTSHLNQFLLPDLQAGILLFDY